MMKLDEAQVEIKVIQDYVPSGNHNRPGDKLTPSSITIHNTDNNSKGANAAAHAKYMKGPDAQKREVSWHFTVDDMFVYQSLPTTEIGWHSGTKAGNHSSIGIEICEHSDMKDPAAAYERAALLAAWLAYRLKISVPGGILQHHDWSGKECPHLLRKGGGKGWKDFLKQVQSFYDALEPVDAVLLSFKKDDHHHGASA
jgi:N-acetylmuramoyl-L-alanine amidase CwlA